MSKEPRRNVYVGHRYVPLLMEEWDKTISYEGLSIVTYQGASYTSKKRVPVGIDILNEDYWVVTGNYNAQIEHYRQDVRDMQENVNEKMDQTVEYVDGELLSVTSKLDDIVIHTKDFGAKCDGVTDDTQAIQDTFNYARDNNVSEVIVSYGESLINGEMLKYQNSNSRLVFRGGLKLKNSADITSTLLQFDAVKNVDIINLDIDGNRQFNITNASRGKQFNLNVSESCENVYFKGGRSKNAMQNHVQSVGENVEFDSVLFDVSGEHGLYLTTMAGSPRKKVVINNCEIRSWGVEESTWSPYGISLRDYKHCLINNTTIDQGVGVYAYGCIQSIGNYNNTTDNVINILRDVTFTGASLTIGWQSTAETSLIQGLIVNGDINPFTRGPGCKHSIAEDVILLESVRTHTSPAHINKNWVINNPFQWRPQLGAKWINCKWVSNQHSIDTPGGNGILMDLGYNGEDTQHDFINCEFENMVFNTHGLIRSRSLNNLFSGLIVSNSVNTRLVSCGAGTMVVLCRDVNSTGTEILNEEQAFIVENNNFTI